MALIRWNPWSLERFLEEDFELPTIPGISRLAGQGINLYETEEAVVAEVSVPGVPPEKIDVTVDSGIVRVSGSYEDKKEEKEKRRYFMSSMASSFNYAFRLPQGIVSDKEPNVEFDNGMLRMTFPKTKKVAPKRIKILTRGKESKAS